MNQLTNDNMNYIASGKHIIKMQLLDDFYSSNNTIKDKKNFCLQVDSYSQ